MRSSSVRLIMFSAGVASLLVVGVMVGGCDESASSESTPPETALVESESVHRFLDMQRDPAVMLAVRHAGQVRTSESHLETRALGGDPKSDQQPDVTAASLAAAEAHADTLGLAMRSIASSGGASDATLRTLILGPSHCGAAGRSLVRWQKADAHRLIASDRVSDARRRAIGLIDTATAFVHASWAATRLDPPEQSADHQLDAKPLAAARVQAMNAHTAFRTAAATIRDLDESDPEFLTMATVGELDAALKSLADQVAVLGPVQDSAGAFARRSLERFGPSIDAFRVELAERAARR